MSLSRDPLASLANPLTTCDPGPWKLTAYMYRLCLEYARLWADNREAMSFTL